MIRRYLEDHGGEADAFVHHLLTTFWVEEDDEAGRRRISEALRSAGVAIDRPLDDLDPHSPVRLSVVRETRRRPAPEEPPVRERGDDAAAESPAASTDLEAPLDTGETSAMEREATTPTRRPAATLGARLTPSALGTGLAFVGAAVLVIAIFLPLGHSEGLAQVEKNSMIEGHLGIAVRYFLLAAAITIAASRALGWERFGWAVAILGVVGIVFAVVDANDESLYRLSGSGLLGEAIAVKASPGLGIYAAGVGSGLALVGGLILLAARSPDSDT
jgi:hypothetical protein